jgi:hypothetical protein
MCSFDQRGAFAPIEIATREKVAACLLTPAKPGQPVSCAITSDALATWPLNL